jgi:hypothetical protein
MIRTEMKSDSAAPLDRNACSRPSPTICDRRLAEAAVVELLFVRVTGKRARETGPRRAVEETHGGDPPIHPC